MTALRCPACETTHYTAVTSSPQVERVAQLGCEACGAPEPLHPVRAVSATVDGVTIVAREKPEERTS